VKPAAGWIGRHDKILLRETIFKGEPKSINHSSPPFVPPLRQLPSAAGTWKVLLNLVLVSTRVVPAILHFVRKPTPPDYM
jgi:hypothetical protein